MPEKRNSLFRRLPISPATVIASIALIVALGGVAHSAVPGPDGKITACYLIDPDPDFSYVYLIDHASDCQTGETKIDWSQQAADQDQVDQAEAALASVEPTKMSQMAADIKNLLGSLEGAFPEKLKVKQNKILKPFDKKETKALKDLISSLQKNDRKRARFNATTRDMMKGIQAITEQQSSIVTQFNTAFKHAIQSIRP